MNKSFLISDDSIDSRLDRWLRRNICEIPQSLIEKNLRKGRIKVNNKKKKTEEKSKTPIETKSKDTEKKIKTKK